MARESDNEREDVVQLLLERPGLEGWARVCMTLLALTDGIERYMDEEDEHPHQELRRRVKQALTSREEAELVQIAGLRVFEYRAMSEDTLELWQPLVESLKHFEDRHESRIRVWKAFGGYPDRAAIEAWLAQRVSGAC